MPYSEHRVNLELQPPQLERTALSPGRPQFLVMPRMTDMSTHSHRVRLISTSRFGSSQLLLPVLSPGRGHQLPTAELASYLLPDAYWIPFHLPREGLHFAFHLQPVK